MLKPRPRALRPNRHGPDSDRFLVSAAHADGSAGTFYVVVLMQPQRDTASLVAVNAFEESAEFIAAVEASALHLLQLPGETFHADSFESCQP